MTCDEPPQGGLEIVSPVTLVGEDDLLGARNHIKNIKPNVVKERWRNCAVECQYDVPKCVRYLQNQCSESEGVLIHAAFHANSGARPSRHWRW